MSLPSASTRLSVQAGSAPTSTDLIAVWGACATLADGSPRLYSSVQALIDAHGYCEAAEYAALHMDGAAKPILFVPLAISTAGTVGRFDTSGNTGTSVCSVAAAAGGILAEVDGVVKVATGGTVGTDQIVLSISLDGGTTFKPARLGTATTYTIPYVGLVLSFTVGTLIATDTALEFHSVAPLADYTSLTTARAAMAAQQRITRSWLFVGDLSLLAQGQGIQTAVDTYETSHERYTYAVAQLRDRLPLASLSQTRASMTAGASVTFAEVGATGDTITRATGSFLTDGFVAGDTIRVTGSSSNNVTGVPTTIAASVITLNTTDLVAEGPTAVVTITSEPTLTFAEVGASGDTITRNRGSWLDDGFRVGDSITVSGTASNNVTGTIANVTATVITMGTTDLAAEVIGAYGVTVTAGETDAQAIASLDSTFATVTDDQRVHLWYGRAAWLSPITGYTMRRPAAWVNSVRAYQHDIRTPTWWKDLGPVKGVSIEGEHDERTDGGALDARFGCLRTWANGPSGTFIAQAISRANDGDRLAYEHDVAVANLAQTVVQRVTEGFAGQILTLLPPDSENKAFATPESLAVLKTKVDSELARNLLSNVGGEGPRASSVEWTPATDDDFAVSNATLHSTTALNLNGTIVHVSNVVGVR